MKLGLNPIEDDGSRMKKERIQEIVKKEEVNNINVLIAQNMQNGLILFSNFMKAWLEKVKPDQHIIKASIIEKKLKNYLIK